MKSIFHRCFRIIVGEFFRAATDLKQPSDPAFDPTHSGAVRVSEKLSQTAGCDHFGNQEFSLDFAERRHGKPRSSSLTVTICNQHRCSPFYFGFRSFVIERSFHPAQDHRSSLSIGTATQPLFQIEND
nr:hypothetical protein [Rhizobium leguminosarum]